jgi:hypothetical protein
VPGALASGAFGAPRTMLGFLRFGAGAGVQGLLAEARVPETGLFDDAQFSACAAKLDAAATPSKATKHALLSDNMRRS